MEEKNKLIRKQNLSYRIVDDGHLGKTFKLERLSLWKKTKLKAAFLNEWRIRVKEMFKLEKHELWEQFSI